MTPRDWKPKKPKPFPPGTRTLPCPDCNGSGLKRGAATEFFASSRSNHGTSHVAGSAACGYCRGIGRVLDQRPTCPHGIVKTECETCRDVIA